MDVVRKTLAVVLKVEVIRIRGLHIPLVAAPLPSKPTKPYQVASERRELGVPSKLG